MSKLICPFCQQKLDYDDLLCSCINEHCEESFDMVGTELLWQKVIDLKQELDRTRKALEVAKERLKNTILDAEVLATPEYIASRAKETLAEITALEQKESAFVHNKIEFPEYNDNLLEEFDKQFFENGQDDDLTETALEQKE